MAYWKEIILGAIQGITEFLPISSSAHLLIFASVFSEQNMAIAENVSFHIGTLGAIIYYFRRDCIEMIKATLSIVTPELNSDIYHKSMILKLIVATIPAVLIGLLFKDFIQEKFHHPIMTCIPLLFIGVLLWLVDKYSQKSKNIFQLSLLDSLLIGILQSLALIPGVSRSGSTILMGRGCGLDRQSAAKFSFLLGIPVMLGAIVFEIGELKELSNSAGFYVGILSSFIFGVLTIKILLYYLNKFSFFWIALYRAILAGLVLFYYK